MINEIDTPSESLNEELMQKQKQLNQLFEDLMSDEMKKLYEELQQMMKELNKEKILKTLNSLNLARKTYSKKWTVLLNSSNSLKWIRN